MGVIGNFIKRMLITLFFLGYDILQVLFFVNS
jgi:hypothetical protein